MFGQSLSQTQITELQKLLENVAETTTDKTGAAVDEIISDNLSSMLELNKKFTHNEDKKEKTKTEIEGELANQYTKAIWKASVDEYHTKKPFIIGQSGANYIFLENDGRIGDGAATTSPAYKNGKITFGSAIVQAMQGTANNLARVVGNPNAGGRKSRKASKKSRKSRRKTSRK